MWDSTGNTVAGSQRPRTRPSWLQPASPGSIRDAFARYPIARRLPVTFSPERLLADLQAIPEDWWDTHEGDYHDGGWQSVSLWAPGGDRRQQRSRGGPFRATEALDRTPYFLSVLDAFTGKRHRVRLMRLRAGSRILRHSDPMHTISRDLMRIHVPIVTSPQVHFRVNNHVLPLAPGDAWTIDVRFPHEVDNRSDHDRVHLLIDLIPDASLQVMLTQSVIPAHGLLIGYFVRHSLPGSLRRWLNVGN